MPMQRAERGVPGEDMVGNHILLRYSSAGTLPALVRMVLIEFGENQKKRNFAGPKQSFPALTEMGHVRRFGR